MKLLLLAIPFFLFSCQPDFLLNETQEIDQTIWKYDDKKTFETQIENVDEKYQLLLILRHDPTYSYENIYIKIRTEFPTLESKEERITISLADSYGQWVGKCSGKICETKIHLLDQFKFPEKGSFKFIIEQNTREEMLSGIHSVNLQILPDSNE